MDGGLPFIQVEAAAWRDRGIVQAVVPCGEDRGVSALPEPEVPHLGSRSLSRRTNQYRRQSPPSCTAATDTGYVHGADPEAVSWKMVYVPVYALLGMMWTTRERFTSFGFICGTSIPERAWATRRLPALGLGQWAKLQLWKIDAERVIDLDRRTCTQRRLGVILGLGWWRTSRGAERLLEWRCSCTKTESTRALR